MSETVRQGLVKLLERIASDAICDYIVPPQKPQDGDHLEAVTLPTRLQAAKVMIDGFNAFTKADGKSSDPDAGRDGATFDFKTARTVAEKPNEDQFQ